MGVQESITEVRVDRTFNLGNFENIKIGFTATINDKNQDISKTVLALDKAAIKYRDEFYLSRLRKEI